MLISCISNVHFMYIFVFLFVSLGVCAAVFPPSSVTVTYLLSFSLPRYKIKEHV